MGSTGIMVCGHGSRNADAVQECQNLARALAETFPGYPLECGFLELAQPTIADGLAALHRHGVKRILAVPAMLFAGGHVQSDIPAILDDFAANHDGITVRFGRELGFDEKLIQAAADRIDDTLGKSPANMPPGQSWLLVVGRGTTDAAINDQVKNICRTLAKDMGFGGASVCYAGTASPSIEEGLEDAAHSGFSRVVVFPYLLFTGVLANRIYALTDDMAQKHPDIDFLKASYLGNHPQVVGTVAARIRELDD